MEDKNIETERRLTKLEEREKSNTIRLNEHGEEIEDLKKSNNAILTKIGIAIERMSIQQETGNKQVSEIKDELKDVRKEVKIVNDKVDVIENKPNDEKANKWDKASWLLISGVITGALGFILGKILGA